MLHTQYRVLNEPTEFTKIIFEGVEGYRFENDAFGNVIFEIETVPVEELLKDFGDEIKESYRLAGSPGPWAADLDSGASICTRVRRKLSYSRRLTGCRAGFSHERS